MFKNGKRLISLLIVLIMVVLPLASCGGGTASTDTTASGGADTTVSADTEITRANYPDTVPTDLDFGGETLTIILNCCDTMQTVDFAGQLVLSSYGSTAFDGTLLPWEAVILRGE